MWQSVPKDSATFSFALNPALQSNAWPQGHRATSWNTPTQRMMIGTVELFCMSQNVHFFPLADRGNQVEGSHAVASNTRGGLHYSKECGCMRTNNNTNVHAQMLRVWSRADRSPGTAYVNCSDCSAPCASITIYVGGGGTETTGLSLKLFEGSPKQLLQILTVKKIPHGSRVFRLLYFFFLSKPQMVVYGLVLWSIWAAAKLRPVDGAKHNSPLFVFFDSSLLWNNIKPSHHPIPPVALSRAPNARPACGDPQHPEAFVTHRTSLVQTGCHGSDRKKSQDPN